MARAAERGPCQEFPARTLGQPGSWGSGHLQWGPQIPRARRQRWKVCADSQLHGTNVTQLSSESTGRRPSQVDGGGAVVKPQGWDSNSAGSWQVDPGSPWPWLSLGSVQKGALPVLLSRGQEAEHVSLGPLQRLPPRAGQPAPEHPPRLTDSEFARR